MGKAKVRDRWVRKVLVIFFLSLVMGMVVPCAHLGKISSLAAETGKQKNGWSELGDSYYKKGKKVTGLQKIGKKYYYFDTRGKLVKEKCAYLIKVNGKKCYYNIDAKGVAKQWKGAAADAAAQLVKLKANLNKVTEKKMNKSLKKAFLWASKLPYRDNTDESKTGSAAAQYYGTYAFQMKMGDCNTQAYAFYWMAKVLGYKPKYVKGYVPDRNGMSNHAWVVIKKNGKKLVYDPNFNATYRGTFGKYCGFGFTYGTRNTYKYYNAKKVEIQ